MWQTWVQFQAQDHYIIICHFLFCGFAYKTRKPCAFFPSTILLYPLSRGFEGSSILYSFSLISPRGNHRWTVRTDEYESQSFCFPGPSVILDVDEFTNPRENRLNKMAKQMNSEQHRFRGLPEISWSFIYTYSYRRSSPWTSPWTRSVVGVPGPGISDFGLPAGEEGYDTEPHLQADEEVGSLNHCPKNNWGTFI